MKKFNCYVLLLLIVSGCANTQRDSISNIEHPAPSNSMFPFLYTMEDSLYMSWLSFHSGDSSYSLNFAHYKNDRWDSPQTIARDTSWFINWADFPSIVVGKEGPLAAHWLDKIPGGPYAYNVNLSLTDSVANWSPPVTPHTDSTATEHGFVSMIPWDEQTVLVVWLDGRQSSGSHSDDYYDLSNAMTLRGALISATGEVRKRFLIDDAVCDCCQTSLVKTKEGAIVAFRDRTEDEVRDIYVSRFNGDSWTSPEPVYEDGWKIGACPVNGPKLAAQDSLVTISWFTAANDRPVVKAALSTDGGHTFGQPMQVSEFTAQGRVGATFYKGKPFVSWIEKEDSQTYVKVRNISAGNASPEIVGTIDESRQSGFPQLVSVKDKLILAWTDISGSQPRVKMMKYTP